MIIDDYSNINKLITDNSISWKEKIINPLKNHISRNKKKKIKSIGLVGWEKLLLDAIKDVIRIREPYIIESLFRY